MYSNLCKDEDMDGLMMEPSSNNAKNSAAAGGSQYLSLALELLGRICTRLREVVRLDRELPLVFPDAVELTEDSSASPNDSDQVIGCPCGISVNTGGFMLVYIIHRPFLCMCCCCAHVTALYLFS
jgi:hypothetical protein